MNVLFLIGRIVFGGFFVWRGIYNIVELKQMTAYSRSKGVPAPGLAVVGTALLMLAGGLSILLGYQPVIGGWLLVIFLIASAYKMHNFWAEKDPMIRMNQMHHFWKNIALAAASLLITSISSWPWSLQ
ncbi:MAG: DoxX family protein [Candidatus Tectomicrobia bacterium]|uniref:DoxX family protein n=1 Tax=Tectimicrobiota bacterium TaxID=2528274 RepID=A0A932GSC8_UNCTE|nr:DoxX family protein [Candidatus Tectomicrobia bacterium]